MTLPADRLTAIQERVNSATEGPWAWESIAEKSNEFVVGLAWGADGQPVRGQIQDDPDAMQDTVIERRMIGMNESGHANFGDAEFIAHAREDIPYLLQQLAAAEARAERLETANHKLQAIVDLERRAYERLNLCPDHRDKATGRCIVCDAETRTARESARSKEE